jgi:hypothetical protein
LTDSGEFLEDSGKRNIESIARGGLRPLIVVLPDLPAFQRGLWNEGKLLHNLCNRNYNGDIDMSPQSKRELAESPRIRYHFPMAYNFHPMAKDKNMYVARKIHR